MNSNPTFRVAVLDLYNGKPNQGMRCVHELLTEFEENNPVRFQTDVFDVRVKEELPDLSYDIYISSGGPGSPTDSANESWDINYFRVIDQLIEHNLAGTGMKKHMFFICHSFQMLCRHLQFGEVTKRHSTAFGVVPIPRTSSGYGEPIFSALPEPFYAIEHRDYQVIQPDQQRIDDFGANILALEVERPYTEYERAIQAIRFSPEMFGTQFHPEADVYGMKIHLNDPKERQFVIEKHGEERIKEMLVQLEEPNKIHLTRESVIPTFLSLAVESFQYA